MKKLIFAILLMFFTISSVNAVSTASGYALSIKKGDTLESYSTGQVTSEEKTTFNNAITFSNSFLKINGLNVDELSITDAHAVLGGPLSMTITGDNTIELFTLTSCSVFISGTGSLKFKASFYSGIGAITDEEELKQFVSSRVKTELPITYEGGYVYVNKSNSSNNTVKEEEDNNKTNEVINSSDNNISQENNENTNTITGTINDNSDTNNTTDNTDDKVVNSETDNATSNNITNDSVDDEESNTITKDGENIIDNENNNKKNIAFYIGITVVMLVVVGAGVGTIFTKKRKKSI